MSASTKKKLRKEENAAKLTEKQLAEQKEAKKLKGYTLIFAIVVSLILVAAIAIMGVTAFNNSGIMERNTDALTVGEHTLNNAELNYFFIDVVNQYYSNWQQQYGEYASMYLAMMGLDMTQPLNTQAYAGGEEGQTYADFFKEEAIAQAANAYTIYDLAVKEGHTVSEEVNANYQSNLAMLNMYAEMYGYNSLTEYLKVVYGPGASEESYREYMNVMAMSDSYQAAYYEALTYDDAAIAAHSEENFDDFSSFDYCQYLVDVDDFIVCSDPENKDHKHTVDEIAAAEAAAKAAADQLAAATAADAAALNDAINALDAFAKAETKEACSEYENVLFSNINNEDIAAWLTEDGRTAGDIGIVTNELTTGDSTTLNGYYVLLFLNREDNNMNLVNVRHILASFKGGKTDSATGVTTYTDEEKKEALDRINAILDQWKADGATEEAFAALATEKTEDTGSKANGGLYENVYPGQMVTAFNDWCFASERKTGDYEIVETEYGYHLIYFVDYTDVTYRNYMIENTLRNTEYETWYTETTEAAEAKELNTKYLALDMVLSRG